MCGDTACPSCAPAQGYSRCDACGEWSTGEGSGCVDPKACEVISRQNAEAEAQAYLEMDALEAELARWERSLR